MYLCILDADGETLLHRNMQATPEAVPACNPESVQGQEKRPTQRRAGRNASV